MAFSDKENKQSLIRDFSKGAFVWYNFRQGSSILYIYSRRVDEAVTELLESKGEVENCSIEQVLNNQSGSNIYDYIVGIDVIEESRCPQNLLDKCHQLLKPDGRLIVGVENRYAIKYICGDRDPYTNHNFDGIENYRRLSDADRDSIAGRCYSMSELKLMLSQAGFENDKFYSVMPSLQETQLVYAERYEPVEELAMRYFPLYNYPDSVFLEEQYLYTDLIKNGMFHKMANAYIIECSMDGRFDDTLHATISLDRGHDNALVTSIFEYDGVRNVLKRAVYKEGIHKLKEMQDNLNDLHARGINVVDSSVENDTFVMPYVDAPVAMNELKAIAKKDKNAFLKAMDDMYELILNSSEHTGVLSEKDRNSANGRDVGPVLARGYIDMVPLNCFYDESAKDSKSRFVYYDQEFYWENCPAKAVMYRSIMIIYDGTDKEFERIVPRGELFDRYGLSECEDMWQRMSSRFTDVLRNQKPLRPYYENKRIDGRILYTNREKINYSAKEYQKIFVDIFDGFDDSKKLILFGSGRFTERFLFQFAGNYNIYSIVDNNSAKWGTTMQGVPVNSPDILKDIPKKDRHIIICIKGYNGVVNQLKDMGITDYHIYDPGNDYPNKRKEHVTQILAAGQEKSSVTGLDKSDIDKPYNVGYIAGVFDLFHIGHLNMFKRAKEQCRYLIVGVVSDEGVRLNKQAEPFVPFDERIEMVRSCKYVDEAIKLPLNLCGTKDIFNVYHFDVQFSGSDYEHDPGWLAEKEFLEKNGSAMVFFPYTQSTSSTKLKKAIESRINN
ncbi:MAG: adenylyltransferase/cytidyltransferase family protein [Eubacterium sp.]|nr:adenylyltransferase/cytidyltransferase family protein [Eubacterium sp.]